MIYINKITPTKWLWQAIKTRCFYLGYASGFDAYVWELDMPFGKRILQHTIEHEKGHIAISMGMMDMTHKEYDRITWHGKLQWLVNVPHVNVAFESLNFRHIKHVRLR